MSRSPQTLEIMNRNDARSAQMGSLELPARRGRRPKTVRGPLHIQCNQHGDLKYLNQLVDEVLTWPYIESAEPFASRSNTISIRLMEMEASNDPSAFITDREFARVFLGVPTIYLVLPLLCAHRAIVRGWAEPHYLGSQGLMPAGTVVVYTPKDVEELAICTVLSLRLISGMSAVVSDLHIPSDSRNESDSHSFSISNSAKY